MSQITSKTFCCFLLFKRFKPGYSETRSFPLSTILSVPLTSPTKNLFSNQFPLNWMGIFAFICLLLIHLVWLWLLVRAWVGGCLLEHGNFVLYFFFIYPMPLKHTHQ